MSRVALEVGRGLLFAFGVAAPIAWGVLTFFERTEKAAEAALALTVVGATTGLLLQWAWLSRMNALAERLERRLSTEWLPPSPSPSLLPSMGRANSPEPPARSQPMPTPAGRPPGPGPTGKRPAPGSPSSALGPRGPVDKGYGNYGVERSPESSPPPFPPRPEPAESGRFYGGEWTAQEPASASGAAGAESARSGRQLEPAALAAAWNDLLCSGNGVFDAKTLAAALLAANVKAEIQPPDNFVGLGIPLLVAVEPGQRERAFLLPDFTRLPKAFVKWFDLGPAATAPSARIERLSRPAELKRCGDRYELAVKGLLE